VAGDQQLGRSQLPDPGLDGVDIDGPVTLLGRPAGRLPIFSFEARRILGQLEPGAAAIFIDLAHHPVTLQPAADIPAPLLGGSPNLAAMKPTIHQQMGVGAVDRFKLFDFLHSQVDFADEGNPFLLTDHFLAIQPRREGTASSQQHIQPAKQTVSGYHLPGCG